MDYLDRVPDKEVAGDLFPGMLDQWFDAVVKQDNTEVEPIYLKPGEHVVRTYPVATTFVEAPLLATRVDDFRWHE